VVSSFQSRCSYRNLSVDNSCSQHHLLWHPFRTWTQKRQPRQIFALYILRNRSTLDAPWRCGRYTIWHSFMRRFHLYASWGQKYCRDDYRTLHLCSNSSSNAISCSAIVEEPASKTKAPDLHRNRLLDVRSFVHHVSNKQFPRLVCASWNYFDRITSVRECQVWEITDSILQEHGRNLLGFCQAMNGTSDTRCTGNPALPNLCSAHYSWYNCSVQTPFYRISVAFLPVSQIVT